MAISEKGNLQYGRGRIRANEVLLTQYKSFLDVYKHHFDLFLKGVAVYLVAMSTIAGFAFGKEASENARFILSLLIPCGSVIAFFGFLKCRRWVFDLQKSLESIETELKIQSFPFSGPKSVIFTMLIVSAVLMAAGFINLIVKCYQ